jgi:LPS O-antigen subunit length determinant protein (WzzB/FepE family)
MTRNQNDVKPTSPALAITLALLALVCFLIGLWVLMAIVRIVMG